MMSSILVRGAAVAALGFALFSPAPVAHAQTRTPRAYASTLSTPRATRDPNGHVVVSMEATGDLKGMITFELDPDGDAGAYSGKWAMVVAYVQDVNPDGTISTAPLVEEHGGPEPPEYIRFVRDGSVFGAITNATVRTTADGAIDGVAFAQLIVASGSLKFAAATGNGSVTTAPTDPVITTLSLNF
jgi:surface antigen